MMDHSRRVSPPTFPGPPFFRIPEVRGREHRVMQRQGGGGRIDLSA